MNNKILDRPVFIIALHRTGSTLLKNILDLNSELAMATDEMHLYVPFSKTTFGTKYEHFNNLENDDNLRKLVNYIYFGEIKGTFWKEYKEQGISEEELFTELKGTDRTLKTFITVLLNMYRVKKMKNRVGVKYPLHFSKTKVLQEWFPDAKFILLTRDIRAVCASKLNDSATKMRKEKFGFLIHYLTLSVFILDYIWLSIYYSFNKKLFYEINYEKLIMEPKDNIQELCKYCNIPYEENMLNAIGKPSSHVEKNTSGFDQTRISSWKTKLTTIDRILINFFTYFSRKVFK